MPDPIVKKDPETPDLIREWINGVEVELSPGECCELHLPVDDQ